MRWSRSLELPEHLSEYLIKEAKRGLHGIRAIVQDASSVVGGLLKALGLCLGSTVCGIYTVELLVFQGRYYLLDA